MNFFQYISNANRAASGEKVALDGEVSGFKRPLAESYPQRIRRIRSLIEYVPRETADRIVREGVALIKTIGGKDNHLKISKYLMRVFLGLNTREDFIAYLMNLGGVSEERAEFIADDQMAKAAERFLVEKWKRQGYKKVRWVHKGAHDPRDYHLRQWNGTSGKRTGKPNGLNGFVFDIDKPPVINLKTKARGYPGWLPNCHCRLEPIKK